MNTVAATQFEPPADFADPRCQPDFETAHWPLCNGEPAPPSGSPGLHERRCIEFLAAFYHLNVLNGRLLHARQNGVPEEAIRSLLKAIDTAMAGLETMEDRYAPIGFFGEPVMDGIRYANVVFARPELPRIYAKPSPVSSHIAVPGLDEIPLSELRGPVNIVRWDHGKVDL